MSDSKIKKLSKENLPQFKELLEVFTKEFEMDPEEVSDDASLLKLLDNPSFIAMVATVNGKVAGGLTGYVLPAYYGNYSEVYLYDIAILAEHQRSGLGTMLIEELKSYCSQHNIKTFFVEAEEKDTHAVNFYYRTRGAAEKVVHFNYDL